MKKLLVVLLSIFLLRGGELGVERQSSSLKRAISLNQDAHVASWTPYIIGSIASVAVIAALYKVLQRFFTSHKSGEKVCSCIQNIPCDSVRLIHSGNEYVLQLRKQELRNISKNLIEC